MDEKTVRSLEKRIEAAVAVYEAAVENYDRGQPSEEPIQG